MKRKLTAAAIFLGLLLILLSILQRSAHAVVKPRKHPDARLDPGARITPECQMIPQWSESAMQVKKNWNGNQ